MLSRSSTDDHSSDSIKFDLYLKVREVKQVTDLLQRVALRDQSSRRRWVKENEQMINQLLDSFMDNSVLALDGIQLDEDVMELSMELMANLRETLSLVQTLLYGESGLEC